MFTFVYFDIKYYYPNPHPFRWCLEKNTEKRMQKKTIVRSFELAYYIYINDYYSFEALCNTDIPYSRIDVNSSEFNAYGRYIRQQLNLSAIPVKKRIPVHTSILNQQAILKMEGNLVRDYYNNDFRNHTLLTYACQLNRTKFIKLIIATHMIGHVSSEINWNHRYKSQHLTQHINEKTTNKISKTALILACEHENVEVIKMLLNSRNCDVNLQSGGMTALNLAWEKKNVTIINMLIAQKNLKLDTTCDAKNGNAIVHLACFIGNIDIINRLVDRSHDIQSESDKTDITIKNNYNETGLHILCDKNNWQCIEYLCKQPSSDYYNSIDLATDSNSRQRKHQQLNMTVQKAQEMVNVKDVSKFTPLMNAVYHNNEMCFFKLVGEEYAKYDDGCQDLGLNINVTAKPLVLVNVTIETAQKALELALLLCKNVNIIKHLLGYLIHKTGVENWESLKYNYHFNFLKLVKDNMYNDDNVSVIQLIIVKLKEYNGKWYRASDYKTTLKNIVSLLHTDVSNKIILYWLSKVVIVIYRDWLEIRDNMFRQLQDDENNDDDAQTNSISGGLSRVRSRSVSTAKNKKRNNNNKNKKPKQTFPTHEEIIHFIQVQFEKLQSEVNVETQEFINHLIIAYNNGYFNQIMDMLGTNINGKHKNNNQQLNQMVDDMDEKKQQQQTDDSYNKAMATVEDTKLNGPRLNHEYLIAQETDAQENNVSNCVKLFAKGINAKNGNFVGLKFISRENHITVVKTNAFSANNKETGRKEIGIEEITKQIEEQLQKYKNIRHENLVMLYSFNMNENYPTPNSTMCVFEYFEHGSLVDSFLFDKIHSNEFESQKMINIVKMYFYQMMDVINTCHNRGIIFKCLKPKHLLINSKYKLKIAGNFGLYPISDRGGNGLSIENNHNQGYLAPEIMLGRKFDQACDIFNAGMILFYLIYRQKPFEIADMNDKIYKMVIQQQFDQFWANFEMNTGNAATTDVMTSPADFATDETKDETKDKAKEASRNGNNGDFTCFGGVYLRKGLEICNSNVYSGFVDILNGKVINPVGKTNVHEFGDDKQQDNHEMEKTHHDQDLRYNGERYMIESDYNNSIDYKDNIFTFIQSKNVSKMLRRVGKGCQYLLSDSGTNSNGNYKHNSATIQNEKLKIYIANFGASNGKWFYQVRISSGDKGQDPSSSSHYKFWYKIGFIASREKSDDIINNDNGDDNVGTCYDRWVWDTGARSTYINGKLEKQYNSAGKLWKNDSIITCCIDLTDKSKIKIIYLVDTSTSSVKFENISVEMQKNGKYPIFQPFIAVDTNRVEGTCNVIFDADSETKFHDNGASEEYVDRARKKIAAKMIAQNYNAYCLSEKEVMALGQLQHFEFQSQKELIWQMIEFNQCLRIRDTAVLQHEWIGSKSNLYTEAQLAQDLQEYVD